MRHASLALALLLTACAHVGTSPEALVSDRLFCGLAIPGGGAVTEADINTFLDEVVEPRFPQGFTVWRARGEWRGGAEETLVLELIHRREPALDRAVREIAEEYRRRFRQEAVMRVTVPAEVAFISE